MPSEQAEAREIWIAVFAAEWVRLHALGMVGPTEEAGRVADIALRAYLNLPRRF